MLRNILVVSLLGLLAVGGCKKAPDQQQAVSGQSKPTLLFYCGAGLREAAEDLVASFCEQNNVQINVDYAGSEVLLSRMRLVQKGDLYMPGDKHYVDLAEKEGFVSAQQTACYFVPAILVQKGNPKNIKTVSDLTRDGLEIGLGDERSCAIGRKCKKIFEKNNIEWADIEKNLKFQSTTVNKLAPPIQTKVLDAVIVWDAIAKEYLEHADLVEIPAAQNVISTVTVGKLKFSEHADVAAEFLDFVSSDKGQEIFRKHNYTVELKQ